MGFAWVLVAGLALAGPAVAQASPEPTSPLDPLETSSPSATYQSFLRQSHRLQQKYLEYAAHKTRAGEVELAAIILRTHRLLELEPLPPAIRDKVASAAITYLVDILNRLPEVPAADIPGAPGRDWGKLPAKWNIPGTDIQIAQVEKGLRAGEYLFTADSLEDLPKDYALIVDQPLLRPAVFDSWHRVQVNFTGPLFPNGLQERLPIEASYLILDTPVWKVMLSVVLVLAVVVIAAWWARLARRAGRGGSRVRQLGWRLSSPLLLIVLYVMAVVFIRAQLHLSGLFSIGESFFSSIVLYGAGAWLVWNLCFFVAEAVIASPRIPDNSYDAHLLRLAARLGGVLAVCAVLLYGANNIGIPALGLVAGLGVGGIAVALASQSTLENLIGGLSIFADRPFRIGDAIRFEGQLAHVEAIGPRSCRIRALDGTLISVPNGDLAKRHIINVSMRHKCLFLHEIGLRYETSPEQLQWLLGEVRGLLSAHPMIEQTPGRLWVAMTGFGDSALTVEIRAHVLTSDFAEFLVIQERLLMDIMRVVHAAGTGFAFPSRTAYLARDTGIDIEVQERLVREMGAGTQEAERA
ncbi:mechanosensitive ion channel family protein [Xanthobacter agilis]|uniref:MscS family membrane protein n=1 Tax=Xanthobacter agilis TaxID=47492 RepID=A0ABU0LGR6_XANAG|nr:mechanosensitive ion channel domain-containing protein [Xanthobacter agilis]MDQ0506265.1 MscS family membrane protein [Xanthobacter agilis]